MNSKDEPGNLRETLESIRVEALEAIQEALTIGHRCGAAVQISHNVAKIGAPEGIMQSVLAEIERARSEGLDVAFDVGAYLGGQTTPLASLPPWAFDGGPEKTLERLADPAGMAGVEGQNDGVGTDRRDVGHHLVVGDLGVPEPHRFVQTVQLDGRSPVVINLEPFALCVGNPVRVGHGNQMNAKPV